MFECYEKGIQRLLSIFRQEILHTEPINTKGRTAKNVVVTKVEDLKKMISNDKKSKKEHEKEAKRLSSTCSDVFPGESNNSIQNTFVSESHEMMFSQLSSIHTQNTPNTSNLSNPQETSSFITFLDPITDISQLHASKRKKTQKKILNNALRTILNNVKER